LISPVAWTVTIAAFLIAETYTPKCYEAIPIGILPAAFQFDDFSQHAP
jgi:hypothetical protein